MKIANIFVAAVLLLALSSIPAFAEDVPALPHAFYGEVTVNGNPAPPDTVIEARVEGVLLSVPGNPLTTAELGKYGGSGALDPKLVVQGDIPEGATVTFYVNGVSTGQTAPWQSGGITQLDLAVTIPAPPPPAPGPTGAVGGPSVTTIRIDFFGTIIRFAIDLTGVLQERIELTTADGKMTIIIPRGTKILDKRGYPPGNMVLAVDEDPPPPPVDTQVIGLVYDFSPAGITFVPAATVLYNFDPVEVPEGAVPGDLVLAFYDAAAADWVACDCTCDEEEHCITADVHHFTSFAVLAAVTPVALPTIEPAPEPAPVPPTEPAPAPPPEPKPVPAPAPVPVPEVAEAPEGINWPLITGIVGGAIVAALIIFFLVRWRTRPVSR